ncbi:hypothetical protein DDW05_01595 [Candidatus Nanobsidianus stetteri]|uniref:Uncharacterized protein n=1 Tax=Nanobsidianus stetteri TaxID=1294122 RepID=A0A2T9WTV5_NANST|nr:hypothetical protein DDW05_01595 [Candidatus Nanobsidianus stetteri]
MFHTNICNRKKPVFKDNEIYLICYNPPFIYIDIAEKILNKYLLAEFGLYSFIDEWTIEDNAQECKVKAILLYYGLPLIKHKIPNAKIPNLEDLKNSSNKYIYYIAGMYWLLVNLSNVEPFKIKKLLNLTKKVNGRPIKVKELEGQNLIIYPNMFDLLDFYNLIQRARTINIWDYYNWVIKQL